MILLPPVVDCLKHSDLALVVNLEFIVFCLKQVSWINVWISKRYIKGRENKNQRDAQGFLLSFRYYKEGYHTELVKNNKK